MDADRDREADSVSELVSAVRGSNQSGMRAHNERLVLSLLRRHGAMAKAELARATGLSAQTASVIMRKLEDEGLIERCAPVRGKVGQPSVPMQLAEDGAFFFGVKVGRRSADLVLLNFRGKVLGKVRCTYKYPLPEDTIAFIRDSVGALSEKLAPAQRKRIAGLGIGIPGYLWEWAKHVGVPSSVLEPWRDRDFASEVAELFDFPVFLQNDGSCACGAELVFGKRDLPSNFLYFYVGYFVGGGVVLNNELFTGTTGNAGALGPLPVPTRDGKIKQLVEVVSLSGLEAELQNSGQDGSRLWSDTTEWDLNSKTLNDWLDRASEHLAYALSAACSLIDFETVVIDGWLPADLRRDLVVRTRAAMPGMNWAGLVIPEVHEGTIGPDARSIGAASLPLSAKFLID